MNVNELKSSKFLKRSDVGAGVLVTIAAIDQQNVAKEGAPEELRWCMHFEELEKPMVLNSTNGQIIAAFTGSDDSEGWIGHKVVLYDDPNVSFGGKLVGGIRCRKPNIKKAAAPAAAVAKPNPKPAPVAAPDPAAAVEGETHPATEDDNLPF